MLRYLAGFWLAVTIYEHQTFSNNYINSQNLLVNRDLHFELPRPVGGSKLLFVYFIYFIYSEKNHFHTFPLTTYIGSIDNNIQKHTENRYKKVQI